MNTRLLRVTLAASSVLIASIVVGRTMVFVCILFYNFLTQVVPLAVALPCLIAGALILGSLVVLLGQVALSPVVSPSPQYSASPRAPDQIIAGELGRLLHGGPTKLIATSLGVGVALGLSPRLRRRVYRALIE
jgi:hypothetical protein